MSSNVLQCDLIHGVNIEQNGVEGCSLGWTLLYRDTFAPVIFVRLSDYAGIFCESIETKYRVLEQHLLVFCKLIQYRYIRHGIVFHI